MKKKRKRGNKKMKEEVIISLEEISTFYEKYDINPNEKEEYPQIPTAFEDVPLIFTNSTVQRS